MASQAKIAYLRCGTKEALLDRISEAVFKHLEAVQRLSNFTHLRDPGFAEAYADAREDRRTVFYLHAEYFKHRREHGC